MGENIPMVQGLREGSGKEEKLRPSGFGGYGDRLSQEARGSPSTGQGRGQGARAPWPHRVDGSNGATLLLRHEATATFSSILLARRLRRPIHLAHGGGSRARADWRQRVGWGGSLRPPGGLEEPTGALVLLRNNQKVHGNHH